MEANLSSNGFACYKAVFSRIIDQTEQQDCVVPDTLPDVAEILYTSGCVLIRSKDVVDGQVRLEANLPTRVSCVGETGDIFSLDVNIPFYINAEDAAIRDGCVCMAQLTLRHLETRLLNPRKLSVRAEVSVSIRCFFYENMQFCGAPTEDGYCVHCLEEETAISAACCVTEKTFVLTDEYELPAETATPTEIIAQSADILTQEIRTVGSKLIVRGSVRSILLYRVGSERIEQIEFATGFSQVVETQTETEDTRSEVAALISGMYYELTPGTEGRSISTELHLVLQLICTSEHSARYLADAYSNAYPIEMETESLSINCIQRELLLRETCRAEIETASSVSSVVSCVAAPLSCEIGEGEIIAYFRVVLCWRCGEKICSMEKTLSQRVETAIRDSETLQIVDIAIQDSAAIPSGSGAEVRIPFELRAFVVSRREIEAITAITYHEEAPLDTDDQPTLVMMKVKQDASLWKLAKENCSTVEAICALNQIEDGAYPEDQFLLIPKAL